eukprot:11895966-Karenia_brevis.AAC.1
MIQKWIPKSKFLVLTAILDEQDNILSDSVPAILGSLATHVKPMLDGTCDIACSNSIEEVLSQVDTSKWNWNDYKLPGVNDICKSIKSSKDNTPGVDGIPNSA